MSNSRNIFLWALYDFANSLVQIVFFLYFAQWIVINKEIADIYFNLTFTVAAILLLLSAPLIGSLLDSSLRRITGLRYSTVAVILFYSLCAFCAVVDSGSWALVFFSLGLYSYLLTFTFYTPLINDIANPKRRGAVSGFGVASHYAGQFVGLLVALPFSIGVVSLFGGEARAETLLPSVCAFALFALPMLIWFKEPKKESTPLRTRESFHLLFSQTKQVFLVPSIGLFLLAYFLFNDAILTASNNFPIFLDVVWGVPDTIKTYILLGIIVTSGIGGLVSGLVADRMGHKRTLVFILAGWVLILPLLGVVQNFTLFVVVATIMGFWFGSHWTVSRSMMAHLAPKGGHNLSFAYFSLVERASSFVGPVFWGVTVGMLSEAGNDRYRISMAALSIFVALGLLALSKVKSDKDHQ
jgi:UMF1 family MFS transporter